MPVVGRHTHVISILGRITKVNPFTPEYEAMQIPILYADVRYDFPCNGESYILMILNALHVPSMRNNLLSPFMPREAGIKVNERPNIQVKILLWIIT